MKIRPATSADSTVFVNWSVNTPHNYFDPAIASYPNLMTFTVEKDGSPILYLPVHPVLTIESAAVKPGITAREYIEALLAAKAYTEQIARQSGMREIHTSSAYQPMIKTLMRHGYKTTPLTFLRKKL